MELCGMGRPSVVGSAGIGRGSLLLELINGSRSKQTGNKVIPPVTQTVAVGGHFLPSWHPELPAASIWSSMAPPWAWILTQCPHSQAGGQGQQGTPDPQCRANPTVFVVLHISACAHVCLSQRWGLLACWGCRGLCCQCSWKEGCSRVVSCLVCALGKWGGVSAAVGSALRSPPPVSGFCSSAFPSLPAGCCGRSCQVPTPLRWTWLVHHHPVIAIPGASHVAVPCEWGEQIPRCRGSMGCPLVQSMRRFWPSPGCSPPHSCSPRPPGWSWLSGRAWAVEATCKGLPVWDQLPSCCTGTPAKGRGGWTATSLTAMGCCQPQETFTWPPDPC